MSYIGISVESCITYPDGLARNEFAEGENHRRKDIDAEQFHKVLEEKLPRLLTFDLWLDMEQISHDVIDTVKGW